MSGSRGSYHSKQLGEFGFEKEDPIPPFKDYAETFLNGFSKINLKFSTHDSYKSALENHIYPVFRKKRLNEIKKKDINPFAWDEKTQFEKAAREHYPGFYPLLLTGHNIADVSKQLGHHSINITVDTYYHWIPGTNKSKVDLLDNPTSAKAGNLK